MKPKTQGGRSCWRGAAPTNRRRRKHMNLLRLWPWLITVGCESGRPRCSACLVRICCPAILLNPHFLEEPFLIGV